MKEDRKEERTNTQTSSMSKKSRRETIARVGNPDSGKRCSRKSLFTERKRRGKDDDAIAKKGLQVQLTLWGIFSEGKSSKGGRARIAELKPSKKRYILQRLLNKGLKI